MPYKRKTAHKKSVALRRLHWILEVLDYLTFPITTSKAHAFWRERRCFTLGMFCLKVSKFQRIQCISYFAFSYSMVCIIKLCGLIHRHPVLVTT